MRRREANFGVFVPLHPPFSVISPLFLSLQPFPPNSRVFCTSATMLLHAPIQPRLPYSPPAREVAVSRPSFSSLSSSQSYSTQSYSPQSPNGGPNAGPLVRRGHFSFSMNTFTNSGVPQTLPRKSVKFSRKVFIGGLPVDVPMDQIGPMFSQFGRVFVDWPQRPDSNYKRHNGVFNPQRNSPGYVFLVFEEEASVEKLLSQCFKDNSHNHYILVSSATVSNKPVQVRPWFIRDGVYAPDKRQSLDDRATVFIGGVPRPTKARDLVQVFEQYFGQKSVVFCSIDMDPELDYPKGAARVTFRDQHTMLMALKRHFVDLPYMGTHKRVEIKPYLIEEQHCDQCDGFMSGGRCAPYFCPDPLCYQYFCEHCWDNVHYHDQSGERANHIVIVRQGEGTRLQTEPPHHFTVGNYLVSKNKRL
ncbi:hypothetical protein L596_008985 [Steinernema carpocapsae]|uniref:RRM domain-containing protein n=1 Tax=Steinernema carpocapsae TaxID=34508 RepID=A0A4U5PEV7_STECR|nr:hypothetical protein L596_008985 [Steinernema carpocapsae]